MHSLIELKDHVDLLKKEVNYKNNIIRDLNQIVKERHNVAIDNEICKSFAKLTLEHDMLDMEHNMLEVLSDRSCDKTNEHEGL